MIDREIERENEGSESGWEIVYIYIFEINIFFYFYYHQKLQDKPLNLKPPFFLHCLFCLERKVRHTLCFSYCYWLFQIGNLGPFWSFCRELCSLRDLWANKYLTIFVDFDVWFTSGETGRVCRILSCTQVRKAWHCYEKWDF